jgi:hypothetical protein
VEAAPVEPVGPVAPVGPTCVYITCLTVTITPGVSGIVGLECVVNVSTVTAVLLQCQYISIKSLADSVDINGVTAIKCAGIPALFLAGIVNTELLSGTSTPFFLNQT